MTKTPWVSCKSKTTKQTKISQKSSHKGMNHIDRRRVLFRWSRSIHFIFPLWGWLPETGCSRWDEWLFLQKHERIRRWLRQIWQLVFAVKSSKGWKRSKKRISISVNELQSSVFVVYFWLLICYQNKVRALLSNNVYKYFFHPVNDTIGHSLENVFFPPCCFNYNLLWLQHFV